MCKLEPVWHGSGLNRVAGIMDVAIVRLIVVDVSFNAKKCDLRRGKQFMRDWC